MRQNWIVVAVLLFVVSMPFVTFSEEISANPSNCEKGYCTPIECEKGYCEGWEGLYEVEYGLRTPSGALPAHFYFKNNTNKTAFNIRILINFKDYFGKHISRAALNDDGPISAHIGIATPIPKDASKITYEIYWSDEYLPARQTQKPTDNM